MDILNSCTDCDEIQFMEDGSWCPMKPKKENQEVCQTAAFNGIDGMGPTAATFLHLGLALQLCFSLEGSQCISYA